MLESAKAIAPECRIEIIGIRPVKNFMKFLSRRLESRHALENETMYIIQPEHPFWTDNGSQAKIKAKKVPVNFRYASDNNTAWLTRKSCRLSVNGSSSSFEIRVWPILYEGSSRHLVRT